MCGYLIGSVNLSILVSRFVGKVDIRTKGSGNAGGTNVSRVMGAKWGIGVIVLEILKAVLLGLFAKFVFPVDPFALGAIGPDLSGAFALFGCLLGNMYPCFHKFKGGKGVTTCGAVMVVLDYRVFLILLSIFLIVMLLSRMVSLGSICAATAMPFSVLFLYWGQSYAWSLVLITGLMAAGLIFRHTSNVRRILAGTDNKIFSKKK